MKTKRLKNNKILNYDSFDIYHLQSTCSVDFVIYEETSNTILPYNENLFYSYLEDGYEVVCNLNSVFRKYQEEFITIYGSTTLSLEKSSIDNLKFKNALDDIFEGKTILWKFDYDTKDILFLVVDFFNNKCSCTIGKKIYHYAFISNTIERT